MVFLDLELGDENGFDIAEQIVLMNNDAIIIFVTSHENLVYEAFRFRPLGYIVKDRFDREFTRMMVKIVDKLIKMRQVIELVERNSMLTGLFQLQRRKGRYASKVLKEKYYWQIHIPGMLQNLKNMDLCSQARVCLLT